MTISNEISMDTIILAFSIVIAALGWFVQSALEKRRMHRNRVAEIRLQFLTETYIRLVELVHVGLPTKEEFSKLALTINSAFLYGDSETVEMIKNIKTDGEGTFDFGPILRELRNRVRIELELNFDPNDPSIAYFGGTFKSGPNQGERFGPSKEVFMKMKGD